MKNLFNILAIGTLTSVALLSSARPVLANTLTPVPFSCVTKTLNQSFNNKVFTNLEGITKPVTYSAKDNSNFSLELRVTNLSGQQSSATWVVGPHLMVNFRENLSLPPYYINGNAQTGYYVIKQADGREVAYFMLHLLGENYSLIASEAAVIPDFNTKAKSFPYRIRLDFNGKTITAKMFIESSKQTVSITKEVPERVFSGHMETSFSINGYPVTDNTLTLSHFNLSREICTASRFINPIIPSPVELM